MDGIGSLSVRGFDEKCDRNCHHDGVFFQVRPYVVRLAVVFSDACVHQRLQFHYEVTKCDSLPFSVTIGVANVDALVFTVEKCVVNGNVVRFERDPVERGFEVDVGDWWLFFDSADSIQNRLTIL